MPPTEHLAVSGEISACQDLAMGALLASGVLLNGPQLLSTAPPAKSPKVQKMHRAEAGEPCGGPLAEARTGFKFQCPVMEDTHYDMII